MVFDLHAVQLTDRVLTRRGQTAADATRCCGASVTFEISESGLLEGRAGSLECLWRLRMMGCRLPMNYFGADFSSMRRLCQLPFNEIKLDAKFVRNLKKESRCLVVIDCIMALGKPSTCRS